MTRLAQLAGIQKKIIYSSPCLTLTKDTLTT